MRSKSLFSQLNADQQTIATYNTMKLVEDFYANNKSFLNRYGFARFMYFSELVLINQKFTFCIVSKYAASVESTVYVLSVIFFHASSTSGLGGCL
jgi:hypothetical protein